jgi:hypothetical protein
VLYAEEPQNGFFFVSAVAARIDTDSWEFSSFTPSFDSKRGYTEDLCYLTDGQEIWEIIDRNFLIWHIVFELL